EYDSLLARAVRHRQPRMDVSQAPGIERILLCSSKGKDPFMETAGLSPTQSQPRVEQNESGLTSRESVLTILKLISAGSPLSETLAVIARLVESRGKGMLCTIWLPDEDGKKLHCAAAPSLPGFSAHVGPTFVGPKGASCGTAVYRREPV